MQHLATSCDSYDRGNKAEALRLAVIAYILVQDSSKTRSIFSQLGIKDSLQYASTNRASADHRSVNETILVGMTLSIENGIAVTATVPKLERCKETLLAVDFDTWWDKEIVWQNKDKLFLNRRRLVGSMRNQDGGAHLDPEVTDPGYVSSSRESHWTLLDKGKLTPVLMDPHLVTMRQIAWEIQKTVQNNPDKFLP